MKTSLFSTVGAIALAGLCVSLVPSTASAHGSSGKSCSRGGHSSGHSCSRGGHASGHSCSRGRGHCEHLPHGCRSVNYHGRRCWFGGGHYYDCSPLGGYEVIDQPEVDETVVDQPVADPVVDQTVVDESVQEDDATATVSVLPVGCTTVYVGGERCWFHDGCYFRHCDRGFARFHCHDRGPVARGCARGPRGGHCGRAAGARGCHGGGHGRR
jgi:hypothetical protein